MVKSKIHILFLLGSAFLLALAGKNLYYSTSNISSTNTQSPSFEIDEVVNNALNINSNSLNEIEELFPNSLIKKTPSKRWLMLFVTEANQCSNCLNEINDYISLANDNKYLFENSKRYLIYHSDDLVNAKRFISASEISDLVDGISFIKSSDLNKITIADESQLDFEYQNFLFLIDLYNHKIFHQFILPTGRVTAFDSKKIAINNAFKMHTNNLNKEQNEN